MISGFNILKINFSTIFVKSYDYAAKRNRELHDKVADLEFQNMLLRENFKLRNKKDFDPFQEQEIKMKNLQKKFDLLNTEKENLKNDFARITTEEDVILSFLEKLKENENNIPAESFKNVKKFFEDEDVVNFMKNLKVNESTKESNDKIIEELKKCLKKKNEKIIDLMSEISRLKLEKTSSPRSEPVTERITEKAQENPVRNLFAEAFENAKNKKVSEQETISPEKQREAIEKFKNLPVKEKNNTVEALKELAATPTKIQSDKNTKEISAGFTGKG